MIQDEKEQPDEEKRKAAAAAGYQHIRELTRNFPEADPFIPDANGWSVMHYACAFGKAKEVELFLAQAKKLKRPPLRQQEKKRFAPTGRLPGLDPLQEQKVRK